MRFLLQIEARHVMKAGIDLQQKNIYEGEGEGERERETETETETERETGNVVLFLNYIVCSLAISSLIFSQIFAKHIRHVRHSALLIHLVVDRLLRSYFPLRVAYHIHIVGLSKELPVFGLASVCDRMRRNTNRIGMSHYCESLETPFHWGK